MEQTTFNCPHCGAEQDLREMEIMEHEEHGIVTHCTECGQGSILEDIRGAEELTLEDVINMEEDELIDFLSQLSEAEAQAIIGAIKGADTEDESEPESYREVAEALIDDFLATGGIALDEAHAGEDKVRKMLTLIRQNQATQDENEELINTMSEMDDSDIADVLSQLTETEGLSLLQVLQEAPNYRKAVKVTKKRARQRLRDVKSELKGKNKGWVDRHVGAATDPEFLRLSAKATRIHQRKHARKSADAKPGSLRHRMHSKLAHQAAVTNDIQNQLRGSDEMKKVQKSFREDIQTRFSEMTDAEAAEYAKGKAAEKKKRVLKRNQESGAPSPAPAPAPAKKEEPRRSYKDFLRGKLKGAGKNTVSGIKTGTRKVASGVSTGASKVKGKVKDYIDAAPERKEIKKKRAAVEKRKKTNAAKKKEAANYARRTGVTVADLKKHYGEDTEFSQLLNLLSEGEVADLLDIIEADQKTKETKAMVQGLKMASQSPNMRNQLAKGNVNAIKKFIPKDKHAKIAQAMKDDVDRPDGEDLEELSTTAAVAGAAGALGAGIVAKKLWDKRKKKKAMKDRMAKLRAMQKKNQSSDEN